MLNREQCPQHRWALTVVKCVLLASLLRHADGAFMRPMGFHEGAKHRVRCEGYISGLDFHFGDKDASANAVVGVRVHCSTSRMQVDHWGAMADDHVFGRQGAIKTVSCPEWTGVAALLWRRAPKRADGPIHVGGIKALCGSESSAAAVFADAAPNTAPYNETLACSRTAKAPKGPSVRATTVDVWAHYDFNGLQLIACEAAAVLR